MKINSAMTALMVNVLLFSVGMTIHITQAFFTTTTQTQPCLRSTTIFSTLSPQRKEVPRSKLNLAASSSLDDDIKKQVAKAKELLEKAKAKQAEQEATVEASGSKRNEKQNQSLDDKRNRVTKSKTEGTGLITTDGDLMALLSEDEEWELKALEDVFDDEIEMDDHRGLADRDVAASIFNLRMTLHNDDYKKIFDSRNRWIGEDN
jgi:hypothetical protein